MWPCAASRRGWQGTANKSGLLTFVEVERELVELPRLEAPELAASRRNVHVIAVGPAHRVLLLLVVLRREDAGLGDPLDERGHILVGSGRHLRSRLTLTRRSGIDVNRVCLTSSLSFASSSSSSSGVEQ